MIKALKVSAEEYPEERLIDEHVALLNYNGNEMESGYYLGVCGIYRKLTCFSHAIVVGNDGRIGPGLPLDDFTVINDPLSVMHCDDPFKEKAEWRKRYTARLDKSRNIVSDEYLISHRLALISDIVTGKQYLAVSHYPDLDPAVWIQYICDDNGPPHIFHRSFREFDILSDPLDLLDPSSTDWKKNVQLQKELRPELYHNKGKLRSSAGKRIPPGVV